MEKMVKNLVEYVANNINSNEISWTYSRMCIERRSLYNVNNVLFFKINDLMNDFVKDNDLDENFLENNFLGVNEVFERIIDF